MINAYKYSPDGTVFFEEDDLPGIWIAVDQHGIGSVHFDTGVQSLDILTGQSWMDFEYFVKIVTHYARTGYYPYKIELRERSAS